MSTVETVRGPVDVADLGKVLMHEHVFVLGPDLRQNYPDYPNHWDEDARVANAVEKLRQCKARGIDTIVDPTVIGLGRYIPRIQRINEQVDLNIIVATGLYTYNEVPFSSITPGPAWPSTCPSPWWNCLSRTSGKASRTRESKRHSSSVPSRKSASRQASSG